MGKVDLLAINHCYIIRSVVIHCKHYDCDNSVSTIAIDYSLYNRVHLLCQLQV